MGELYSNVYAFAIEPYYHSKEWAHDDHRFNDAGSKVGGNQSK
jgi:hypothetical protein